LPTLRNAPAALLALVCFSSAAAAQAVRRPQTNSRQVDLAPRWSASALPPAYNWDLHDMSRYAGWGGAIGAVGGFAWGEVRASRHQSGPLNARPMAIIGDALLGFCAGMVGGSVVYVVHLVRQP
jgi:hypothetical protein